jgi:hypothetical protein
MESQTRGLQILSVPANFVAILALDGDRQKAMESQDAVLLIVGMGSGYQPSAYKKTKFKFPSWGSDGQFKHGAQKSTNACQQLSSGQDR